MKLRYILILLFLTVCFSSYASVPKEFFGGNSSTPSSSSSPSADKNTLKDSQTKKEDKQSNLIGDSVKPQFADNQKLNEHDAKLIQKAQEEIAKKNPDQKGGYVAEVIDKGRLSDVSQRHPEFFGDKARSGGNPVEVGRMVQFNENGDILSDNLYVKGGGNGNTYGTDKLEYMSMPYGKYNNVWKTGNGTSQLWSDTDGQWVNPDSITLRVNSNPNSAVMSPGATTERVHPLSSSGVTNGCYGLIGARYSNGSNSSSDMINFANNRVYLGRINGLSRNGNQVLAGYRTQVGGVN